MEKLTMGRTTRMVLTADTKPLNNLPFRVLVALAMITDSMDGQRPSNMNKKIIALVNSDGAGINYALRQLEKHGIVYRAGDIKGAWGIYDSSKWYRKSQPTTVEQPVNVEQQALAAQIKELMDKFQALQGESNVAPMIKVG